MVVVGDMLPQDETQVIGRQGNDLSPNLTTNGSDKALNVGIEIGRVRRQQLWLAANRIKARANLGAESWAMPIARKMRCYEHLDQGRMVPAT